MDTRRSSWSLRHDEGPSHGVDRVFEALMKRCRDAVADEFGDGCGYTTTQRKISGPVEGLTINVTRGRFAAQVSVQRFVRPGPGLARPTCPEIRVVTSARHTPPEEDGQNSKALARWGIAGCAAGTMGLGSAGLELAGLLSAWGEIMLLIPALMAWRMCIALRIVTDFRRQAALDAQREQLQARREAIANAHTKDLERWSAVERTIEAQRDAVAEQLHLRPFRSQGPIPGTVGYVGVEPLPLPPRALASFG